MGTATDGTARSRSGFFTRPLRACGHPRFACSRGLRGKCRSERRIIGRVNRDSGGLDGHEGLFERGLAAAIPRFRN
jgi:hypothetical protein